MSNTTSTYSSFDNGLVVGNIPILSTYPGKIFWADSVNGSNGNRGTFKRPFASAAFIYANAANIGFGAGDRIYLKNGHVEAVIAAGTLDVNVAATVIVFLGQGSNKAQINFTTVVGADMDIDAANITLINPLFVAGIDALTGPIDVNAADFTMIGAEYRDAAGIDTTDAVIGSAASDRMIIDGYRYVRGDEAGTQKQSHIQVQDSQGNRLNNIDITGNFAVGNIENGTAFVDSNFTNMILTNKNATVCISLASACTGWIKDTSLRVPSGEVFVTAGTNVQFDNVNGTGTDDGAATEVGLGGGGAGSAVNTGSLSFSGTNSAASTTAPVVVELAGFGDDFFNNEYFMYVVKDAGAGNAAPEGEYRLITDYVSATGTFTVNAFGTALAANDEVLVLHKSIVNSLDNVSFAATNTAASTTAPVVDKLAGFGNDYFNNEWYMTVIKDAGGANAAPEGETRLITDYVSATGTFTTVAFGTALADGDKVSVAHKNLIENHVQGEKATTTSTAVMVNADIIFTIAGGPIKIEQLVSQCITGNDATATTIQYNNTATLGGAATFTAATATIANLTAGEAIVMNATALATAPDVTAANLVALASTDTRGIIVDAGTINLIVGVGSTTGTFKHFLRWKPLAPGVTVVGT